MNNSSEIIFVGSILINDTRILVVPNTLKVTFGRPTVKVTSSIFGNTTRRVSSINLEDVVGKIEFKADSTPGNLELLVDFKSISTPELTLDIAIQDFSSNRFLLMSGASIVNDPQVDAFVEGKFDIMIEGNPISIQSIANF